MGDDVDWPVEQGEAPEEYVNLTPESYEGKVEPAECTVCGEVWLISSRDFVKRRADDGTIRAHCPRGKMKEYSDHPRHCPFEYVGSQ